MLLWPFLYIWNTANVQITYDNPDIAEWSQTIKMKLTLLLNIT